jgi:hypothetical protein
MKVLLYDKTLSFITPGGKTTHANKLYQELKKLGVNIEFGQWWNKEQADYDLVHTLAHQVEELVDHSHKHGKKIILTHIMDSLTSKSKWQQKKEKLHDKIQALFPFSMDKINGIRALAKFDHIVYMHNYDRETALYYYPKIDINKTSIIPHAFDPRDMHISNHLKKPFDLPEKFLISVANIDSRKQSHLLAKYAKLAEVPIVFIGGANKADNYYEKFAKEIDNQYVFYLGYVSLVEKDYLQSKAVGYALLSFAESGCIAVYEAAAYNLPLFLSNLPWAWGYEDPRKITFCDYKKEKIAVEQLKHFYATIQPEKTPPFKAKTWAEIAKEYRDLYIKVLEK